MSTVTDPIGTLLDAIKAKLQTAFPATRWHYSEQNEGMSAAECMELTRRLPHIGLGWAGWQSDGKGNRRFQGNLKFKVWIVVKNTGLVGRLRGDPLGPGLYASSVLAAQLLQGVTVPGVGAINVASVSQAFSGTTEDANLGIATIEGSAFAQLDDVAGLVDGLPAFTGLDVDWDLARAEGNATDPDAQDTIALPGAS